MEQRIKIKTDSLLECARCLGCHEFLTIPVYQCRSGHSLCSTCISQNSLCSECGSPVSTTLRNHSLERVLESVEASCRFVGCSQQVPLGNRLAHETECSFNPQMQCFFPLCAWFGDEFIEHLKTNHSVKEFAMPKTGGVRGWNSKSWKNADWGYSIWKFDQDVILTQSYSDGEAFYVYVYDLHDRRRVHFSTITQDYGAEFEVMTSPLRSTKSCGLPFHVSIAEVEFFLLEPAHELEAGYKRLSLNVRLVE